MVPADAVTIEIKPVLKLAAALIALAVRRSAKTGFPGIGIRERNFGRTLESPADN